jgi:hypothetical protein
VGVLVVELGSTVVSQTLLETALKAPALINTNGPGIKEDLAHIGNTNLGAGADNAGILAGNALHDIEILESESGHDILHGLPFLNLLGLQVDNDLGDLLSLALNDDGERAAIGSGNLTGPESLVLGLGRLPQGDAVELDGLGAGMIADDLGRIGDFPNGKLVYTEKLAGGL